MLEKLANFEVGRLSKVTFAKGMFLEDRALSQIQLASVLTKYTDDNMACYFDGTSRHRNPYTNFNVKRGGRHSHCGVKRDR